MSNEMHTELKRSLFGLSPKKVSSSLRRMKNLQAEKQAELEEKVLAEQEIEAQLQAELAELEARSLERAEQKKYQDFILQRAEEAAEVLRAHTQQQLLEMQKALDQKQEAHRQTMLMIDQQINSYNQLLQSLLQEFDTTLHQFSASSLDGLLAVMGQSIPLPTAKADAADVSTKVVPLKLKTLPVQMNDSTVFETSQLVASEVVSRVQERTPHVAPHKAEPQKVSSAFWGNVESFLQSEEEQADWNAVREEQASSRLDEDWRVEIDSNEAATTSSSADLEQAQENTTSVPSDLPSQEPSKESEGITAEIASIRNRYIVGKVAGATLFDQQGRQIIAQGATITAEIVALAEREGKLPDLIVNMKVQGLDHV